MCRNTTGVNYTVSAETVSCKRNDRMQNRKLHDSSSGSKKTLKEKLSMIQTLDDRNEEFEGRHLLGIVNGILGAQTGYVISSYNEPDSMYISSSVE